MKKLIIPVLIGILFFTGGVIFAQNKSFPDVNTTDWFYNDVMNMVEWDVIRGNDDGTFKPSNNVNRAELSVMWNRYEDHINKRLPENVYMDIELSTIYLELAWMNLHMAEQYRVNNLVYSGQLVSGMSLPCNTIKSLKGNASSYLERAKKLTPTVVSQDNIDLMMDEFDSKYNNCREYITIEGL